MRSPQPPVTATIRIPVEATAPVSATARVTVGRVTVTATLTNASWSAPRPREAYSPPGRIASRRVCVRARTVQAAHTAALNKAYSSRQAAARGAAKSGCRALPDSSRCPAATRAHAQQMAAAGHGRGGRRASDSRQEPLAEATPPSRRPSGPNKQPSARTDKRRRYPAAPERAASASSTGTAGSRPRRQLARRSPGRRRRSLRASARGWPSTASTTPAEARWST